MNELRRLIASPSALFTFEAAARLGSFTRAAAELGVTQAAVSFAIKSLEGHLGATLFRRRHQRIELTEAGERFYRDVSLGLGHIGRSAEALHRLAGDRHVTLSCSTAFAAHWLLPRLPGFRATYPTIDFRIQTSDKDIDIVAEKIELGVRRGRPSDWPDYDTRLLAPEILFPVCSPRYLETSGPIRDLEDLAKAKLIHLEEPTRPRPNWRDWFGHHGLGYKDDGEGLRLNDYALVVQAAIGAQGIALGWTHIVEQPMRQGLLAKAHGSSWRTGHEFHIVSPRGRTVSADATRIRDWILGEAERRGE